MLTRKIKNLIAMLLVTIFFVSSFPSDGSIIFADMTNPPGNTYVNENYLSADDQLDDNFADPTQVVQDEQPEENNESQAIPVSQSNESLPDRMSSNVIVKYKKTIAEPEVQTGVQSAARNARMKSVEVVDTVEELKLAVVDVTDGQNVDEFIKAIEADPTVEYAQPNYKLVSFEDPETSPEDETNPTEVTDPDDETDPTEVTDPEDETDPIDVTYPEDEQIDKNVQWALKNTGQVINGSTGVNGVDINITPVWESGNNYNEVIVAVLDTGVDTNHPDLQGQTVEGFDFVNMDNTVFDEGDTSHGTNISGIIAAKHDDIGINGVSQNVKIMPLKFIQDGYGYTTDAIAAIEYAKEKGVKIINCSWGSDIFNPILKDVMTQNKDIIFVAAAGNDGTNRNIYPAAFDLPNVISVASINNTGNLATSSNYGTTVDVAAPGVNIYTTGLNNTYEYTNGTSMAAAHVSAASAIYLGKNPQSSSFAIKEGIYKTVRNQDSLIDKVNSNGILDISNLLQFVYNGSEEPGVNTEVPELATELVNVLSKGNSYKALSEEDRAIITKHWFVREDTMLICEESGLGLRESKYKALIMQILDISLEKTIELISNYENEFYAYSEVQSFGTLQMQYGVLNDENKDQLVQFLIEGYGSTAVVYSFIVSSALAIEQSTIISKTNSKTDNFDYSSFSLEDQEILKLLIKIYKIKSDVLLNYQKTKNITLKQVMENILVFQQSSGLFIDNKNTALGLSATTKSLASFTMPEVSAPFKLESGKDEKISLNSGFLTYDDNILTIPGKNGLDLNLSLQYNSERANVDKVYGTFLNKDITNYYFSVFAKYYYFYPHQLDNYSWNYPRYVEGFQLMGGPLGKVEPEIGTYAFRTLEAAESAWESFIRQFNHKSYIYQQASPYDYDFIERNYYWKQIKDTNGNGYIDVMKDNTNWKYPGYIFPYPEEQCYFRGPSKPSENKVEIENNLKNATPFEYMGAGWSLNFPKVSFDKKTNDKTIKLEDGSSYVYKYDNISNLKGYKLKDLCFYEDPWSSSYPGAKYYLTYASGTKDFFDYNGNIIARKDRFNNTIKFENFKTSGLYSGQLVITDSANQRTTIDYNTNSVIITTPDQKRISYQLDQTSNGYQQLTKKTNELGLVTNYKYSADKAEFKITEGSVGDYVLPPSLPGSTTYNNLVEVKYNNGATTSYTYESAEGYIEKVANFYYYRVKSRQDNDGGIAYNKQTYLYSSNNWTGYPTRNASDKLDSSFTYNTTVTDDSGMSKTNSFNNTHLLTSSTTKLNSATKESTLYTYNTNDLPTKITNYTYGSTSINRTQLFDYDQYGNVLNEYNTQAEGNTGNTEFRTTYTYNPTYNMLTSKTYKKDSSTTIKEEYTLSSDAKTTQSTKVYENGSLKGQTSFGYDSFGNVTSKQSYADSGKYINTSYTYQNGVFLASETTGGVSSSITYDLFGRILTTTDGNGNTTKFEYDKLGRQTKMTNPDGSYSTTTYDDYNNISTSTGVNGQVIKNTYDRFGNLKLSQDTTNGAITLGSMNYDNKMRVANETSTNGTVTYYTYDNLDRILTKTVGNSLYKESYVYDDACNSTESKVTKTIEGDTNAPSMTTIVYTNKHGLTSRQSRLLNGVEYFDTFKYDYLGNKIEATTAANNKTLYVTDYAGRVTKTTNPDVSVYQSAYDWLGRKTSSTDPKGSVFTFTYDDLSRVIKEESPFEGSYKSVKTYVYDGNGNILTDKITNNKPGSSTTEKRTDYVYNNRNFLTKVSNYNNGSVEIFTEYKYDTSGNKTEMITANGTQVNKYEYDKQNRLVKMTDALNQIETYTYDNSGNLITKKDRNGNTTTNTYDTLNRLTNVKVTKDGVTVPEFLSYSYSKLGSKVQEKNESLTTDFQYDSLGRLLKQTESNGIAKTYTYDISNNRKTFTLTQNGTAKSSQSYDYDNMNRLVKTYDSGSLEVTYTYDTNGNRATLVYPNGVSAVYEYNNANLITKLTNKKNSEVISSFSYTYNLDGNQATKVDSTGKTTSYTYDDLGRLTKESETGSSITTTKEYTFDKANNRATMKVSKTNEKDYTTTYTYDQNNRLLKEEKVDILTATTTNYVYDENGNQLSKISYTLTNTTGGGTELGIVVIGDGFNGEESNHVAELSSYDVFNRLIKTQNDKGIILYTYKPDGLRLSKKVNNLLTTHIWDGSNIVLELESGNSVVGKYTRGINLIKNQKGQYFVFNAHGDVVQLTDASGNVVKNYHYDAFGVEENIDKEDSNPFRYCAEYYDKETGTIYLRARYYNPSIGRFISQDPIRSGLNWYTYCSNNPILFADPSGLVKVGLREYASTYKGSTVSWDSETGKASVTYKGLTFSVQSTSINTKNGRIYVDDSTFIDKFGVGEKTVVYQDSVTKNISIRAAVKFSGNASNNTIGESLTTYKSAFISGIQYYWNGTYGQYNVSTYVEENSKGIKTKIKTVNMKPLIKSDKPHVSPSIFGWSTDNTGTLEMRTGDSRTQITFSEDGFEYLSAHEFGHILGVDDMYTNPKYAGVSSIFNDNVDLVQEIDIEKVLTAWSTGEFQTWE